MTFIRPNLPGNQPVPPRRAVTQNNNGETTSDNKKPEETNVNNNQPTPLKPVPVDTLLANNGVTINKPQGDDLEPIRVDSWYDLQKIPPENLKPGAWVVVNTNWAQYIYVVREDGSLEPWDTNDNMWGNYFGNWTR